MSFVAHFHFDNPATKLTAAWCRKAVDSIYFNTDNRNLLFGKRVKDIEDYAKGEWDMRPYVRMFKSLKKKIDSGQPFDENGKLLIDLGLDGIDFSCIPLIPTKLNSAIATVQKIPVEVECAAVDALAVERKQADITFLKNKPVIEQELQDYADQMNLGKVDLGTTKYSFKKFSDSPLGLDLSEPDEENIFAELLYALKVETSFEKALQLIYFIKKSSQIRLLETTDQYKYAVSVNRGFESATTGLPDIEYVYPGRVTAPASDLPDYGDNPHRIIDTPCTPFDLFNYFGDEIGGLDDLEIILNGPGKGSYCNACNAGSKVDQKNWGTQKVQLKYIEVKSVDWVGINVTKQRGKRPPVKSFTYDEQEINGGKIWAQNTYGFWWLLNTDFFFGIHKLGFSHRSKGQESYQSFSSNIYKSQKKSAVELSITENKKAQIADIKLQHCLVKSLPPGKYVDLRFVRSALSGVKDDKEAKKEYTMSNLISMIFEHNQMIGDTEGFDGKNDGQLKPVIPIPGGLNLNEVQGYLTIMQVAAQNIGRFTGINEELTGQSANPEGLVGLQKLLINSSINAIYYVSEAIRCQYEALFNNWACLLQYAIEKGGKTKEAIINFIGTDDVDILDGLNDVPLHNLTIKVNIGQREIERQKFQDQLNFLKSKNVITTADEYLLSAIDNPKERFALLAVIEKKFNKKQDQIRQENFANQQSLMQQQGANMAQVKQVDGQEAVKQIYAGGDVKAKLMQLADQLGLNSQQRDALTKRILQKDRADQQKDKLLSGITAKADTTAQTAF